MGILEEAMHLVGKQLGGDLETLTIERVVVGLFFTGVKLSDGNAGLCFTPIKDIPQAVCCPTSAGRMFDPNLVKGMKAGELAGALSSPEPIKTAVAIAALNALSAACWQRGFTGNYVLRKNMDAQDAVRMPPETSVAVVGAFLPTLRALKSRGGTWWVIEQDPRTLKDDEMSHYVPADASEEIIARADVLIITGVTLVNHSLEKILSAAKPGAEIAVMGPTAGLLPEPLFQRGVRIVGGVWVKKPDLLLDVLAAGGSGYHFFDTLADRIVIEARQ
ncbi:MAG: DUF364 domain-containing protein [Desulfobacterales bacterium]|nr:DUF364 domain-containing protein [Desulfobacterales bacterium]